MTYATSLTFALATVADRVTTGRATADMLLASPFATSPAELPTGVTIVLLANRAGFHTARSTENILAGVTLADAVVAAEMAVAVNGDVGGRGATGMAGGAPQGATVTVAFHRDLDFTRAIAEGHVCFGHGRL